MEVTLAWVARMYVPYDACHNGEGALSDPSNVCHPPF